MLNGDCIPEVHTYLQPNIFKSVISNAAYLLNPGQLAFAERYSADIEDIEDFSEHVITTDECLETLESRLSDLNHDKSGPFEETAAEGLRLVEVWIRLSLEAHRKFSSLQKSYEALDSLVRDTKAA